MVKTTKSQINLEWLRTEMFKRGLGRRELAHIAGITLPTLDAVFQTGMATYRTSMKVSIALYGHPIVADPDLLKESA